MISSLSNTNVKYVRRLQADRRFRHRQQVYVAEGTRWLGELVANSTVLRQVYYTEKWLAEADHAEILAQVSVKKQPVRNDVMLAMSATETPPGALAVVEIFPLAIPPQVSLLLILDGVANPGNLGTILRTAGAAGVDSVLLSPGCVDLYNPKVVRGAMGSHVRLPAHRMDWAEIARLTEGMRVWLSTVDAAVPYTAIDWQKPTALIVCNEAHGASKMARRLADDTISIPMRARTESLNVAIAAAVILFEAVRQRTPLGVSSSVT
jgi:TrmH family RNA methyltransferase